MLNPASSSAMFGRASSSLLRTSTAQRDEITPAQETTNKERAIRRFAEELEKLKSFSNQNKNRPNTSSSANLGKNLPSSSATLTKNEQYAKALLIAVREEIYKKGYKSRNKLRPVPQGQNEKQWNQKEATRISKARAEVRSIEALTPPHLGTTSYFLAVQRALSAQGHNCYDLALAGIGILDSVNIKEQVQMLVLKDFDHAMVLMGHIPSKGLPKKMEDWPSHLAICDPWANIACSATEYIPRVIEKMEKWERRGKKIYNYYTNTFCSPIYPRLETDLRGRRSIYKINTKPPVADKDERTPLMQAAKNGAIEKLGVLIKARVGKMIGCIR